MQITTRATVLALALLASTPLFAGGRPSNAGGAGNNGTGQLHAARDSADGCLPEKLASLLAKPGSTPPDPDVVDRNLKKADRGHR